MAGPKVLDRFALLFSAASLFWAWAGARDGDPLRMAVAALLAGMAAWFKIQASQLRRK